MLANIIFSKTNNLIRYRLITSLNHIRLKSTISENHNNDTNSSFRQQPQQNLPKKLIYEGKLTRRILYLKSVSILSSVALASSYGYVISQKSFSIALAGVGFVFTPFLLSPFVIAWFFKRYITELYYNPIDDTYTAHHYGLLLNKKSCTFDKNQVMRSEVTSMLNTFKVDKKPFFLWEDDLVDVESVQIYKRMIGLSDLDSHSDKI